MNDHNEEATHLRWTRGSPEERHDENRPTVKAIACMIKEGKRDAVRKLLRRWHPRDIVELLMQLPLKRARKLFLSLPPGPKCGDIMLQTAIRRGACRRDQIGNNKRSAQPRTQAHLSRMEGLQSAVHL